MSTTFPIPFLVSAFLTFGLGMICGFVVALATTML